MDHLFSAFVSRRTSRNGCGNIADPVYVSKKRTLKGAASFGSRHSPSNTSLDRTRNSEIISVVDAQLMQIKEKLAAFREQDNEFRERMGSLSDSVSELTSSRSSLSSFTPSECSDLDSVNEASEEEEKPEQQTVDRQRAFVKSGRDHFTRLSARCFHMRRAASDPSSMHSHIELPEEEAEAVETQRHSTYSADQATNLYPQYDNPEKISTLF